MSKLKLIGLGFAALGTIGAGVVGSLGYKKLKMQDEAIDRMINTLEDANDMLIRYEDKVKEQAEKIETLESENRRLRIMLNDKEAALATYGEWHCINRRYLGLITINNMKDKVYGLA